MGRLHVWMFGEWCGVVRGGCNVGVMGLLAFKGKQGFHEVQK